MLCYYPRIKFDTVLYELNYIKIPNIVISTFAALFFIF